MVGVYQHGCTLVKKENPTNFSIGGSSLWWRMPSQVLLILPVCLCQLKWFIPPLLHASMVTVQTIAPALLLSVFILISTRTFSSLLFCLPAHLCLRGCAPVYCSPVKVRLIYVTYIFQQHGIHSRGWVLQNQSFCTIFTILIMVEVGAWSKIMSWWQFKSQRNWFERPKHHRKSRFVLKIISCPMWQESKPSLAGSDTGCSGADADLSHIQLFFPVALAWKEQVERRVQRRQVCCKSTCVCNHVALFLGHMCPPLCSCYIYRSNLSCITSSSPDRSSLS